MKRTLVIAAAIVIAGAMIGGAVLYVTARDSPEVIKTRSAQEVWKYASAGWRCEVPTDEGLKPINLEVLKIFAGAEDAANSGDFWAHSAKLARCTEPSS